DLDTFGGEMRREVRDAIGDMRVVAHRGGHRAVLAIAQELDMLGVVARIGDPDLAGLDPVLLRLLLGGGDADMVELDIAHQSLTTLPLRADSSAARVAASAAVASSGVPMVTVPPDSAVAAK